MHAMQAYLLPSVIFAGLSLTGEVSAERPHASLHLEKDKLPKPPAGPSSSVFETESVRVKRGNSVQPVPGQSVSSAQSWGERVKGAFVGFFFGIFLVPFSLVFLWINERNSARLESVISLGRKEVCNRPDPDADDVKDFDGKLVHLGSGTANGIEPVTDPRFRLRIEKGCLRFKSVVDVFQWVEHAHQKKYKDNRGQEITETTYTYRTEWSSKIVDSSRFHDKAGHHNTTKVNDVKPGMDITTNATIKYGKHYIVPEALKNGFMHNFQDYSSTIGESLDHSSCKFAKDSDGWYYFPKKGVGAPQIGDFRAKFDYVTDGPATIVGLQEELKKDGETLHSFVPYRMIERPWCGSLPEEEKSKALLVESQKTPQEYANQDHIEPMSLCVLCCCVGCCVGCCCNMISNVFARAIGIPDVYRAWDGHFDVPASFALLANSSGRQRWGLRFAGWLLLFIATNMLFQPMLVLIDIIPFLGKYIGGVLGWVIAVICFLLTAALASVVVAVANLRYHPAFAMICLSLAGALAGGIYYLHGQHVI